MYLEEVMEKAGVKKDKDVTEVADTSSVAKPKERKEVSSRNREQKRNCEILMMDVLLCS